MAALVIALRGTSPLPAAAAPVEPSVVVVLADDMRADELRYLPNVQRLLMDEGMTFRRAFVSNSTCCPSRATILTGDYSHTTGVYTNGSGPDPSQGGYEAFHGHGNESRTIALALQQAGYRTGLFGKYLNGMDRNPAPIGWDTWDAFAEHNGEYYDYVANENGEFVRYGHGRRAYSTDVFGRAAVEFIQTTPADQPLFAYYAPYGPHGPSTPPARYRNALRPANAPGGTAAFNERNVSDKPAYISERPRLTATKRATLASVNQARVEALRAVDDWVGRIVHALEDTDRLHDTIIVFASDNGQSRGEHRWIYKLVPYEDSIRVPLVVRADALGTSGVTTALAANTDFAPTLAELTDTPFHPTDGVSLVPTLTTGQPVRRDVLLEHEWYDAKFDPPSFCGLRTEDALFVRYATGEEELYDMTLDPDQLRNRAGDQTYAPQLAALRLRTQALCDPLPPGMQWT